MIKSAKKDKVSFVLYENGKIPRYHQISSSIYKVLINAPSFLIILSLLIAFTSYFYSKDVEKRVRSKEPEIIQKLRETNTILSKKSTELDTLNQNLIKKLANSVSATPLNQLALFGSVAGQKDLTNPAKLQISDIDIQKSGLKIFLRFNLTNITVNSTKLSGYVHIFLTDGNTYHRYPSSNTEVESFQVKYDSGESFATTRFRPVEATFNTVSKKDIVFKVLVFNRLGDIIHQQQFKETLN